MQSWRSIIHFCGVICMFHLSPSTSVCHLPRIYEITYLHYHHYHHPPACHFQYLGSIMADDKPRRTYCGGGGGYTLHRNTFAVAGQRHFAG